MPSDRVTSGERDEAAYLLDLIRKGLTGTSPDKRREMFGIDPMWNIDAFLARIDAHHGARGEKP